MKFAIALLATFCFTATGGGAESKPLATAAQYAIASPDGLARVRIAESGGQLSWSFEWRDQKIVLPAKLSLADGEGLQIISAATNETDRVWQPVWGQFSQIRENFRELSLRLKTVANEEVLLQCRMYNDGMGLRFASVGKPTGALSKINFRTEYQWPSGDRFYWPQGEKEPVGPVTQEEFAGTKSPLAVPVVCDNGAGGFAAVLESDLFSAPLFSAMKLSRAENDPAALVAESPALVDGTPWQTPWRVLLFARSAGGLLESTTPLNLAAECRLADTAWIKPGKAMWDWRVHGYRAGDFRYGINTASYKRFINFAATNNIQYFLIDDTWFKHAEAGRLELSPELDLAEVTACARERGVKVLLYYDRKKGSFGDDALFPHLAQLGAVGVKYGFMGNKAAFTRTAIGLAASNHLLVDFHDSPCPMTGVERTMPNLVSREYCHGQQDHRSAFSPTAFLKMAMLNALTGPLDQANGAYGLNGINAGEREFGPRARNSYNSTVVSETARVLVISSGLICLPDAPEEYAKKADLFEFIRRMPAATWDETRIVNSGIGEWITTARRSGREWFVGSVINERGGELPIALDFLAPGVNYDVTFYEDTPHTHYINNREAYQIRSATVKRGDQITARLAPGGGHCMWIRPHL